VNDFHVELFSLYGNIEDVAMIRMKIDGKDAILLQPFGALLRHLRKEKKITAEKLADAVNIDRTYISKMEQENYLPSYAIAKKLSEFLESPPLLRNYMISKYPEAAKYFESIANTKSIPKKH
jgi:transcriptional regulator with XRE-family HTH domain